MTQPTEVEVSKRLAIATRDGDTAAERKFTLLLTRIRIRDIARAEVRRAEAEVARMAARPVAEFAVTIPEIEKRERA